MGQTITLVDTRDKNPYTVAKLLDGKCWMTQNLRIVNKQISSSDSDMQNGSFKIRDSDLSSIVTTIDDYNHDAVFYSGDTNNGSYYTWFTATAGSGTSSLTIKGENAPNSICPKGWKLPKGGNGGDFMNLYNLGYNETSKWMTSPVPNFLYSGSLDFSDGSWGFVGTAGRFWSSTTSNQGFAYGFYIATPNILQPDNTTLKQSGRTVRCVAR